METLVAIKNDTIRLRKALWADLKTFLSVPPIQYADKVLDFGKDVINDIKNTGSLISDSMEKAKAVKQTMRVLKTFTPEQLNALKTLFPEAK